MAKLKKSFYISAVITAILALSAHGSSSEIEASAAKAVEVAKRIETSQLRITIDNEQFNKNLISLSDKEKIHYYRVSITDALGLRNALDSKKLIDDYLQLSINSNDKRNITLANLYALYDSHRDSGGKFENFNNLKVDLTPYINSSDWVISHRANLFLSVAESYSLDLNTSLANALNAYNQIPNEKSIYVDEAVIESLELIAYLHNLLNNPEMAVLATEKLINKRLESGYEVDGISLINNLIYSFGKWQDFETTSNLTETLISLETGHSSSIVGLSQLRLAQTLNDKGDYQAAHNVIKDIMPFVEHKTIKANLLINYTVALAGLAHGIQILRVHDVPQTIQAIALWRAAMAGRQA